MEVQPYEVRFGDEVEELLQTRIFYDETRTSLLYHNAQELDPNELDARRKLGSAAIRIVARTKSEWRQEAKRLDPDIDISAWNRDQHLTRSYIGAVAFCHQEEVHYLARQMALINRGERFLASQEMIEQSEGLPWLRKNLEATIRNLQTAECEVPATNAVSTQNMPRTLTVSSGITGRGQTFSLVARALGVGKPIEGIKNDQGVVGALVGAIRPRSLHQIADSWEGSAAPKNGQANYFPVAEQNGNEVIMVTFPELEKRVKLGQLSDKAIDILMITDDHAAYHQRMRARLGKYWQEQAPAYSVAATLSSRKPRPGVRRFENLVSEIDDGLMHPVELSTYAVLKEDQSGNRLRVTQDEADEKVAELVLAQLAQGRQGIVFCGESGKIPHNVRLAHRLSTMPLPNGQPFRAVAMSANDFHVLEAYRDGEVDVLLAVNDAYRVFDKDIFDFILINSAVKSKERFNALLRLGKVNDRISHTTYGHIVIPDPVQMRHPYLSMYEAFGFIETGEEASIAPVKGLRRRHCPKRTATSDAEVSCRQGGKLLLPSISSNRVHEGISIDTLMEDVDMPVIDAIRALLRAGFDWTIERQEDPMKVTRYYEPAAKGFFAPSLRAGASEALARKEFRICHTTISDLARVHHKPEPALRALLADAKVPIVERRHNNRNARYINNDNLHLVEAALFNALPIAEQGAATQDALIQEFNLEDDSLILEIARTKKIKIPRSMRLKDEATVDQFYSKSATDALRQELRRLLN